jgi:nucleoid DNA-binding protein
MTKTELLKGVHGDLKAKKLSNDLLKSRKIFNTVIDHIVSHIADGRTIKVEGLGTFRSQMEKRVNSFGDEQVTYPRFIIRFSPAITLKNRLNAPIKATEKPFKRS